MAFRKSIIVCICAILISAWGSTSEKDKNPVSISEQQRIAEMLSEFDANMTRVKRNINSLLTNIGTNGLNFNASSANGDPKKMEGLLASCQLTNVLLYQMLQQRQAAQTNPFLSLANPTLQGLGGLPNLQGAGSFIQPFPAINQNLLLPATLQTYTTTTTFIAQETSTAVLTIPLLFGNKPVPTTITRTKTYNVTSTSVQTLTSTIQPTFIQPTPIIITATPTIIAPVATTVQFTGAGGSNVPVYDPSSDKADFDNDVEESIVDEKPRQEQPQYEYVDDISANIAGEQYEESPNSRKGLPEETESQKALRLIEARRQKGFERRKPKPTPPSTHSRSRNTYRETAKKREPETVKFTRSQYRDRGYKKEKETTTTRDYYYRESVTTPKPRKKVREGTRRRNYVRTTTQAPTRRTTTTTTTTTTTEPPIYEYDQNYYDYYYPQQQPQQQYKQQEKEYDYSKRQPSWATSEYKRQTPVTTGQRHNYGINSNVDYYESSRGASQQQPQYSPVEQDYSGYGQYADYGSSYYSGRRLKRGEHREPDDTTFYGRSLEKETVVLEPSSDGDFSGNYPVFDKCPPVEKPASRVVTITETKTITKFVNPSRSSRQESESTRRYQGQRGRGHVYSENTPVDTQAHNQGEYRQASQSTHVARRADILKSRSRSRYNPNRDAYY